MSEPKTHASLRALFVSFFKIGAFTIGGGLAMLPLIENEFVSRRGWVDEEEMLDILAVSQSLPGVIAINSSLFVGYRLRGIPGALAASAGMIIPSFVTILAIAIIFTQLENNDWVRRALSGIRAGVTALILLSAVKMGKKVLRNWRSTVIAAGAFLALVLGNVHFIAIISLSAAAGLVFYGLKKVRA